MTINVEPINENNFTTYGSVVILPEKEPTSQSNTYKFWSDISDYYIEGDTEIGLCTVYRQDEDSISGMERHLRTPEILIPIDAPFILPLLQEGHYVDKMKAYLVKPGEAVVINKGVWHGACLPAGKNEATYFVIFRKNTPSEDVEKKEIEKVSIQS